VAETRRNLGHTKKDVQKELRMGFRVKKQSDFEQLHEGYI